MKLIITSPCVGPDGVVLEPSSKELEVPNQHAYALIGCGHAKCANSPKGKEAKADAIEAESEAAKKATAASLKK